MTHAGGRLELWNPVVSGDSLIGNRKGVPPGDRRWLGGIRLAEIENVEVRGVDTGKTLLLVGGVVVGATLAILVAIAATFMGVGGS